MSRSRCARARSSASRASPATASRNCWRRWPAFARSRRARFSSRAHAAAAPSAIPRAMRALGVGHVPEDRHRVGLVMPFEACESAMLGFQDEPVYGRGVLFDRRAIIADEAREDGGVRHPPARAAAEDRQFLRRQPAEDRAGARDRAQSGRHPGRPADARRRHRRDRVHPQAHRRAARRGQGGAAGVRRARRDLRARPTASSCCARAHHRRAAARGDQRPGPRSA